MNSHSSGAVRVRGSSGSIVGEVDGDRLVLRRDPARHMLKHCPRHGRRAWAVDLAALDQAERMGARTVVNVDPATGETWTADLDQVRAAEVLDYGRGEQRALDLDDWQHTVPALSGQLELGI